MVRYLLNAVVLVQRIVDHGCCLGDRLFDRLAHRVTESWKNESREVAMSHSTTSFCIRLYLRSKRSNPDIAYLNIRDMRKQVVVDKPGNRIAAVVFVTRIYGRIHSNVERFQFSPL